MRVAVVVAAMLFCAPVFAQDVKLPSVRNSFGMVLIEIPAGKFIMGDGAGVAVTLTQGFLLGKTEVTQGQWKNVMGKVSQGRKYDVASKDFSASEITWDGATEFCKKLTAIERKSGKLKADEEYRLPTEAEWEYACRAGTTTAYSFGDDEKQLGDYAWFDGNANISGGNVTREQYAHKVGKKKPNPWGLHDMHGNVWEWCSDWYWDDLSGGIDPVGPGGGSYRVCRGGGLVGHPGRCRSAVRNDDASHRVHGLGFRVARSQSETVTAAERRQQGAQAEPAPQVAVETRPKMEKPEPVEESFKSVEIVINSIGMELIEIPAGTFTMGDGAGVVVTLTQEFSLGKTEVTQSQWKKVMGSEPWLNKASEPWLNKIDVQIGEDNAASYVGWDDAKEFCKKLTATEHKNGKLPEAESYRLPTEAEWEYACRAGTTTTFSFGDDEKQLSEYAWFDGNAKNAGEEYAHKVDMKKPNPWGLHDMHGNVWEWCSDWYDGKLRGGVDPIGPGGGSFRVYRGGGWWSNLVRCRSALRIRNGVPSDRNGILGFRVARSQSVQ